MGFVTPGGGSTEPPPHHRRKKVDIDTTTLGVLQAAGAIPRQVAIAGIAFRPQFSLACAWFESLEPLTPEQEQAVRASLREVRPDMSIYREKIDHLPDWARRETITFAVYELDVVTSPSLRVTFQVGEPGCRYGGYMTIHQTSTLVWEEEVADARRKVARGSSSHYTERIGESPVRT